MVRAIIFDCFGVILTDALQEIRAEIARHDPAAAQEVRDILAANNRGYIFPTETSQRIAAILGVSVKTFHSQLNAGEIRNERLLAYILEIRHYYKTAMLSNVAASSLSRRFPDGELNRYFDEVITSAEIGVVKPEPEAYTIVAERLGVRCDECIFTDDKPYFCEAARYVGMSSIIYISFDQFKRDLDRAISQSEK